MYLAIPIPESSEGIEGEISDVYREGDQRGRTWQERDQTRVKRSDLRL